MRSVVRYSWIAGLSMVAASCGEGGGGSVAPLPDTIALTTPQQVIFLENGNDQAALLTASVSTGGTPTFSIAQGGDGALFEIRSGNQLFFRAPPNYDLFADANGDNDYVVTIRAASGALVTTRDVVVRVTNDKEGFSTAPFAQAGADAVSITAIMRDGEAGIYHELASIGRTGRVRYFDRDGNLLSDRLLADRPTGDYEYLGLGVVAPSFQEILVTLVRVGRRLELRAVPFDRLGEAGLSRTIWSLDYPDNGTEVTGTLVCRSDCLLGTAWDGDAATPAVAGEGYGEKISFGLASTNIGDQWDDWRFTTLAYGLRDPVPVMPVYDSPFWIVDRGQQFSEVSFSPEICGGAAVLICPRHLGWPYYDAQTPTGATPPEGLSFVFPSFSTANAATGRLVGFARGGKFPTASQYYIIPTDTGAFLWALRDDLLSAEGQAITVENRIDDVAAPTGRLGSARTLVDIDGGNDQPIRFFILNEDGVIFRVTGP